MSMRHGKRIRAEKNASIANQISLLTITRRFVFFSVSVNDAQDLSSTAANRGICKRTRKAFRVPH